MDIGEERLKWRPAFVIKVLERPEALKQSLNSFGWFAEQLRRV